MGRLFKIFFDCFLNYSISLCNKTLCNNLCNQIQVSAFLKSVIYCSEIQRSSSLSDYFDPVNALAWLQDHLHQWQADLTSVSASVLKGLSKSQVAF